MSDNVGEKGYSENLKHQGLTIIIPYHAKTNDRCKKARLDAGAHIHTFSTGEEGNHGAYDRSGCDITPSKLLESAQPKAGRRDNLEASAVETGYESPKAKQCGDAVVVKRKVLDTLGDINEAISESMNRRIDGKDQGLEGDYLSTQSSSKVGAGAGGGGDL